jgi:hypothetical protein
MPPVEKTVERTTLSGGRITRESVTHVPRFSRGTEKLFEKCLEIAIRNKSTEVHVVVQRSGTVSVSWDASTTPLEAELGELSLAELFRGVEGAIEDGQVEVTAVDAGRGEKRVVTQCYRPRTGWTRCQARKAPKKEPVVTLVLVRPPGALVPGGSLSTAAIRLFSFRILSCARARLYGSVRKMAVTFNAAQLPIGFVEHSTASAPEGSAFLVAEDSGPFRVAVFVSGTDGDLEVRSAGRRPA